MNNGTLTETFLGRLRNTTAQSHTNLEELPVSKSIMNPEVTYAEYALYLTLMHDVVKDTEQNIYPLISDIVPGLEDYRKTGFIESDLATLGKKKSGFVPVISEGREITTAFALGIVYVIEGSSLGGRVILKNINDALGHDADNGAKYFAGYGNTTGSHWKNFLNILTGYEAENNCGEEIIAGADYAFTTIAKHFSKV